MKEEPKNKGLIIAALKELLADAEANKLTQIGIVATTSKDVTQSFYVGDGNQVFALIGGIEVVKQTLIGKIKT